MASEGRAPDGVFSLLDTDLYKLTMQCCIIKHYPDVEVSYDFTNRTPQFKFTRGAVAWLQQQIDNLANLKVTDDEITFLRQKCNYLPETYLQYLHKLRLRPREQVRLIFQPDHKDTEAEADHDTGSIQLHVQGLWSETILYEIPLLALTSETYFRFIDRDWSHTGQLDAAREKGRRLLQAGCAFSEFGTRRRRDYKTQQLVLEGLIQASEQAAAEGWPVVLTGTSNVHFAKKFNLMPIGTVAHEWFMGVAAISDDYENANEIGLRNWVDVFGKGVLAIALTDTFGTESFLRAFQKPVAQTDNSEPSGETYAQIFAGVRQDSGDPLEFINMMRSFYDRVGIKEKAIVFSDSLNVERCLEYKLASEKKGLKPSFGVGTFLTNDFQHLSDGSKSEPLNIVIKLGSAGGNPAIKISDNAGKNTGDGAKVAEVKRRLQYHEKEWTEGDEASRWSVRQ